MAGERMDNSKVVNVGKKGSRPSQDMGHWRTDTRLQRRGSD